MTKEEQKQLNAVIDEFNKDEDYELGAVASKIWDEKTKTRVPVINVGVRHKRTQLEQLFIHRGPYNEFRNKLRKAYDVLANRVKEKDAEKPDPNSL